MTARRRVLHAASIAIALAISVSTLPSLQPTTPIVDLTRVTARSTQTFGVILGVKETAEGRVLVNDAGRRQLWRLDSTLSKSTLVADSAPGTSTSYGRMGVPFVRWLGDTVAMADVDAEALLLRDASGAVKRSVALPIGGRGGVGPFFRSWSGVDVRGRLIFRSPPTTVSRPVLDANGAPTGVFSMSTQNGDSANILRFDMDARRIDTLGAIQQVAGGFRVVQGRDGRDQNYLTVNPLRSIDDWSVLSDGTLAIVRGHDYHVDWILPNGSAAASAKLPFDWRRLTDDEKQKLIDSAKIAEAKRFPPVNPNTPAAFAGAGGGANRDGGSGRSGGGGEADGRPQAPPPLITEYVPLKEMADYYPPIRAGALMPDLDGNVWVLPTTSAQSRQGELVYDVINPRDGLQKRVRLPLGRSIVGFGRRGVVYLSAGSMTQGFTLEKVSLPPRP